MMKITVYDDFFKKEFSGEFKSVEECKEFYAIELDCEKEDVRIVKIEEKK